MSLSDRREKFKGEAKRIREKFVDQGSYIPVYSISRDENSQYFG